MRRSARWVLWRNEQRRGVAAKMPLQLNGRRASSTDPRTWTNFRAARASDRGDGIGWILGDGIGCIDLDHCLDGDELAPWAAEIIDQNRRRAILIEVSQSGTGVHIFLPMRTGRGSKIRDGRNIEVYPPDSGRYIAVTGRRLDLGGVTVARELKPCGTPAAARRHRRNGEEVCEDCKAAERVDRAAAKARSTAQVAQAALSEMPENLSRVGELRFVYKTIRAALQKADTKEVAALAKQADVILERIDTLEEEAKPASVDDGDDIDAARRRREERLAAHA